MKEALPPEAVGKPLEIWFQDEARVGQKGTLTRVWARRGSRPRAPRDTRYEWAYIFGAVCPERAIAAALVLPFANREAMNLHLREISQCVSEGAQALLVVDGAGWHTTARLQVPDNITLLILPPYAPELNPVENIWQYLRQNKLGNPPLPNPQGHRRGLLRGLARFHRRTRQNSLHHKAPMGNRVMTYGDWYKTLHRRLQQNPKALGGLGKLKGGKGLEARRKPAGVSL